jgi:hypothetical protein
MAAIWRGERRRPSTSEGGNNANLDRFVHPIRAQSGENWKEEGAVARILVFFLFASKTTEPKMIGLIPQFLWDELKCSTIV